MGDSRILIEVPDAQTLTPEIPEELALCLKQAAEQGHAVAPVGGGTMLDSGGPLERADLLLSLAKLESILDYQPANLTVRTQAGITLAALNQTLAQHGQYVPLDPPLPDRATIGGILATNAGGPLRLRYGAARDLLIGIRAALVSGEIVHGGGDVVKNVAGYDLPKLFIGSLGTLGVITEASFRLAPIPSKTATLVSSFYQADSAGRVLQRLLHSPLFPLSAELLSGSSASAVGLGERWTVLIRFGGLASTIARGLCDAAAWAKEEGGTTADTGDDTTLWERVRDFPIQHDVIVKASVLPAHVASYLAAVEEIASRLGVQPASIAHAVGVALVSLKGEDDSLANAIEDLRAAAVERHGHLVVQRAPLHLRQRVDVWGPTRVEFAMMKKLKDKFDPRRILNPGRFVGRL